MATIIKIILKIIDLSLFRRRKPIMSEKRMFILLMMFMLLSVVFALRFDPFHESSESQMENATVINVNVIMIESKE